MPHSSGGGSHRSGSHRSSSHHSSSSHRRSSSGSSRSSTPSHPIRSTFYPGSRRYRYTHRGRTHYVYCADDPSKRFSRPSFLVSLFIYIPMIFIALFMFSNVKTIPKYADHSIVIKDEAQVLGDTSKLRTSLEEFEKKSGITPAVITVGYDKWSDGNTLEHYAYDRYLTEFNDEMHWLIVYSEQQEPFDYCYEGMQGDDTDPVLTESITNRFNAVMHSNLEDRTGGRGDKIAAAFDRINSEVKKPGILDTIKGIAPALVVIVFILVHMYFMTGLSSRKYKNAVLSPEDEAQTNTNGGNVAETLYTPDGSFSKKERICPSCGMACGESDKSCPVCGTKL